MNILYIDHYAGSLDMGMEFRPYYLAREWQKLGHKVRIIGASFSHLRVKQPEVKRDFEIQTIDGIEYQWVKTITYDHNGSARAISMFQFCSKLWWKAKQIAYDFKPDVVIGSSTYTFDTYPCQRIARLSWAKYIHENHDLWPLTLTQFGQMSKYHPFVLLNALGLKSALRNADQVVCVLPFAYEYFQEYGFTDMTRFHYIPNGVVKEDWENPTDISSEHKVFFQKHKKDFIILYLGSHSMIYELHHLIEAACCSNDFVVVFVGQGNDKNYLINYAKELHCKNVYFLPGVPKSSVPKILSCADVLYASIYVDKCLGQYGVGSNKIYDYMMAGKPILFSYEARNKEVLEANCGREISPNNHKEIIKQIKYVQQMSQHKLQLMGENGQKWVLENCEYGVLANKFLSIMK